MCGDRYRLFACIETIKTWPLQSFAHYRDQNHDPLRILSNYFALYSRKRCSMKKVLAIRIAIVAARIRFKVNLDVRFKVGAKWFGCQHE